MEAAGLGGMRGIAGSLRGRDVSEMRRTLSPRPFLIFISSFRICIPRDSAVYLIGRCDRFENERDFVTERKPSL